MTVKVLRRNGEGKKNKSKEELLKEMTKALAKANVEIAKLKGGK